MSSSKKPLIIVAVFLALTGLILIVSLSSWSNRPTDYASVFDAKETSVIQPEPRKTVYEKNNHPEYPKTKIEILDHSGYLVAVYKDEHRLKLYKNGEIIKEYEVNIKRELPDRKVFEDDQTPEGIFKIDSMDVIEDNPWKRWIRIDTFKKAKKDYIESYPDGEKQIQSFEANYGALGNDQTLRQFNEINEDKKILRGIGIHGGGFSLYHEWTWGCIAMNNQDITELFDYLKTNPNGGLGTKVVIMD